MNRTVTLDLPADVLDQAGAIAQRTGRSLETLLAEWIARDVASDPTTLFTPDAEYDIPSVYGDYEAAKILMKLLEEDAASEQRDAREATK
ncbi:MAG: hypothetical protein M3Z04_16845 [Chloroflexota bacterium]|nr:hypothetical protein [Chloroflexota bacterium]